WDCRSSRPSRDRECPRGHGRFAPWPDRTSASRSISASSARRSSLHLQQTFTALLFLLRVESGWLFDQAFAVRQTGTLSHVDQRALVFAQHDALQRARLDDGEYLDRQALVAAQRKGGGVHDLQVLGNGLVEADRRIAGS